MVTNARPSRCGQGERVRWRAADEDPANQAARGVDTRRAEHGVEDTSVIGAERERE